MRSLICKLLGHKDKGWVFSKGGRPVAVCQRCGRHRWV